ncbi:MAG: TM0106 family RecB-like putative nuclease [Porticoccaceae bacterium]
MKFSDQKILLSATDLMRFMGCAHATWLDFQYLHGNGPEPKADDPDAVLLQRLGDAHEANYLAELRGTGATVVEIPRSSLPEAVDATRATLSAGPAVVYQAALLHDHWGGWADFLMRVDTPSMLGDCSYEVADTKLKRSASPKHLLQLVLYSDLLAEVQGTEPTRAHLILGNGDKASFQLTEFSAYARAARQRLESFIAEPTATRPVPCADCTLCRWADHCQSGWQSEDSLFNVAGITRVQVRKLEASGITTLAALAQWDQSVRGMANATLDKLVTQARLQQARKSGPPAYTLRSQEGGKGFDLLPQPQAGDLFYDIEGDPHYEGGLEYLHGVWAEDTGFQAFWAHTHSEEKQALANLLDYFRARLAQYPEARIYHYAPYEITALRRLTAQYGIGETFLDRLLRERRFVDLYAVVRGGVIISESNYSIKSLEVFYGLSRDSEVKTAAGSVVAYEKWRETGDQSILDEIEEYNRIDCISTQLLRDWLVNIRPAMPWPEPGADAAEKEIEEEADVLALRGQLAGAALPPERQALLFNLGLFHKREAKPAWWAIFDSLGKDDEDLIDDLDALGGLQAMGPPESVKRSQQRHYRFPPQETKLRGGQFASIATDDGFTKVTIETLNRETCTLTLKIGNARAHLLINHLALHPSAPVGTDVIANAIKDVIADQCGPRRFTALDDLLSRNPPRLAPGPALETLNQGDALETAMSAIPRMQNTVLPMQGPPGTGKTYVTARVILTLVANGFRVGVSSNSHEAIRNVLMECRTALDAGEYSQPDGPVTMAHKISQTDGGYAEDYTGVIRTTSNDDPLLASAPIAGGTAFYFSRPECEQAFDWLFVDEAGQVGLANMVGMGRAARNLVLVGDPRQLPQVVQGAHPHPANLSCLEWLQGEDATVQSDRGIFLPVSRRMHPAVCGYISEQIYDGRLTSHPDTARQCISGTPYPEAGAYWVPVNHQGNAQVAEEEIDAIRSAIAALLAGQWIDTTGSSRPLDESDIIVVAPYNAQVNALQAALPSGIRIGTVDKFQGQEAPVCIVSMTASSAEESPRGMDFLYSRNRINVAISRAKALALVFGSPRLREAKCQTVEQMRLVNVVCALEQEKH